MISGKGRCFYGDCTRYRVWEVLMRIAFFEWAASLLPLRFAAACARAQLISFREHL